MSLISLNESFEKERTDRLKAVLVFSLAHLDSWQKNQHSRHLEQFFSKVAQ